MRIVGSSTYVRLLYTVILVAVFYAIPATAQLPGWDYVRTYLIDNTLNTEALTDYQVRIVFDHDAIVRQGRSRTDAGDIRFTSSCNGDLLDYWIEGGTNATACIAWVKISSVPIGGTGTIYMHYGNFSASNVGNPEAVFEFYDDFSGTTIDAAKWQRTTGSSIAFGVLNPVVEDASKGGANYIYSVKDFTSLGNRGVIEAETRSTMGGGNIIFFSDDPSSPNHYLLQHDLQVPVTDYDFAKRSGATTATIGTTEYQFNSNEPVFNKIEIRSNTALLFSRTSISAPPRGNSEFTTVSDNWNWKYIGFSTINRTSTDFSVSYVRVRKYTPVEPSVTEQKALTEALVTTPQFLNLFFRCTRDSVLSFSIRNTSGEQIVVNDARLVTDTSYTLITSGGFTVANGASRAMRLRFTPVATGIYYDTLLLDVPGYCPPQLALPIRGVLDTTAFAVSGVWNDTINFGKFCFGEAKDTVITVTNNSTYNTRLTGERTGPFQFVGDSLSGEFTPGESRGVRIRFTGFSLVRIFTEQLRFIDECGTVQRITLRAETGKPVVSVGSDTTVCQDSAAYIGSAATGGFAPYTYLWQPATGLDDPSGMRPTARPLATTEYHVTVTDAAGCIARDTIVVSVLPKPRPTISADRALPVCKGENVVLSVDQAFSLYRWSTGEGTRSITVSASGDYWVDVEDINHCGGGSDTMRLQFNALPTVTISGPRSACPGSTSSYSIPDSPGSSYQWTLSGGGAIIGGANGPSVTIQWSADGTWTLNLRREIDATGCFADTTIVIRVNTTLLPVITVLGGDYLCEGGILVLTTDGYKSTEWSNGETGQTITIDTPGKYYVNVVDDVGCAGVSDTITIEERPRPQPEISGATSVCLNEHEYTIDPVTSGTILWSLNGGGAIITGQGTTQATIRWDTPGTWDVKVVATGEGECTGEDVLQVTVSNVLSPQITGRLRVCDGETTTLDAGAGYDSYQWSTNETSRTITVGVAGTYSVEVTGSDCSGISSPVQVVVIVPPFPSISAGAGNRLVSTPETAYQWHRDGVAIPGATSRTVGADIPGSYTVRVTDADGCEGLSEPYVVEGMGEPGIVTIPRDVIGNSGTRVAIPLLLQGQQWPAGANKFVTVLRYNGSLLKPLDVVNAQWNLGESGDDAILSIEGEPGGNGDTLTTMLFLAKLGNAESTTLTIDDFRWDGSPQIPGRGEGLFTLGDICYEGGVARLIQAGDEFGIKYAGANPSAGNRAIRFVASEEGTVRLTLTDVLGSVVATIAEEYVLPGEYQLMFNPEDVPQGLYFLSLQGPTQVDVRVIQII